MVRRPMFLRGVRRWLVRLDVDGFEAIVLLAFFIITMLFLAFSLHSAASAPRPVACDAPDEHHVLVWAWTDDGVASCQYQARDRR